MKKDIKKIFNFLIFHTYNVNFNFYRIIKFVDDEIKDRIIKFFMYYYYNTKNLYLPIEIWANYILFYSIIKMADYELMLKICKKDYLLK